MSIKELNKRRVEHYVQQLAAKLLGVNDMKANLDAGMKKAADEVWAHVTQIGVVITREDLDRAVNVECEKLKARLEQSRNEAKRG